MFKKFLVSSIIYLGIDNLFAIHVVDLSSCGRFESVHVVDLSPCGRFESVHVVDFRLVMWSISHHNVILDKIVS